MNELTNWRDEARRLLNNRPITLKLSTIAVEVGVSTSWLGMFGRGEIHNPGVVTIETLIAYLKNYNKKG